MKKHPFLLTLLVLTTTLLAAEPRFRADDGNLWRLADNPALAAVSGDALAAGYAWGPTGGNWSRGTQDLQIISPLLSFRYATNDEETHLMMGSSLGPWAGVSIGYLGDQENRGSVTTKTHSFGLLYRPADVVSTALTVDDAFGPDRRWGAGLGIRPLATFGPRQDWFTLTTDISWNGDSVSWESVGGRFSWVGSDLRVWIDPVSLTPGIEATLALGPSETTFASDRIGTAARWSVRTPDQASFGPAILRIAGAGNLESAPVPRTAFSFQRQSRNLPALVALIDRAAGAPMVAALAFEDPPSTGGLAGAEELRQALERFKKAGKKVYVHIDGQDNSLDYQGWVSVADRISIDPSGYLGLTAGGSRRLYLKGMFDKIGVKFVNFAPWETKSANNTLTFASMPEAERAMLKRFLTDRDARAADLLASGRGQKLKGSAADLVAGGPYLSARETLDQGLVDTLENRASFERFLTETYPNTKILDTLPEPPSDSWGPPLTRQAVALVHLSGAIVMGPGQAGQTIGRAAAQTIAALRDDASIKAIVLRVDSPGGAVLPSDALADEVKRTVAAEKPVVVLMGNVAASGGYYLAAPATRIWARPGTITGSIGVTAVVLTAPKALEMLGIQADGVDLGPSHGFGDWTRDLSETDTKKWTAMIGGTYQRFLDVVSEGRHIDKAKLEPLARGQIYTGREALALGLVDELGGQAEAQAWLEKELKGAVEWREFTPGETDPFGGLLGSLASTAVRWSDSPSIRLAATLEKWAGPEVETLERITAMGTGPLVWAEVE